jgi:hypothetical protein
MRRAILMGLFFIAVAACAILAQHRSSLVALGVSLLVFFLAWNWRRPVIRALAAVYCLAFVLVIPVDFAAYNANLQTAEWLPRSFRARLIIWEYTAERRAACTRHVSSLARDRRSLHTCAPRAGRIS